MTGKCAVCGKEAEVLVCCSTCGGISFAYCNECLNAGREPYDALVGMGIYVAEMSDCFKESILLPSLKFHNKTTKEFDEDVDKDLDAYYNYMHWQKMQNAVPEVFGYDFD